ncbi:MAG: hypothetical protein V1746_01710 [bacterium]
MAHVSQIGEAAKKEAGFLSRFVDVIAPKGSERGPSEALGIPTTLFPSEHSDGEKEQGPEQKTYGQEMSAQHRVLASRQTADHAGRQLH